MYSAANEYQHCWYGSCGELENQYNCTLSWLLDGIFLNDTGGGTCMLQKGTISSINAVRDAAVRKCERSARA